jgi:4-amino-4-deoxy-L-arabinose transferase-like glycosyltransferase
MNKRHTLIVLLCLAWIVPGLIAHDPWKSDEAYTFGVVYELLQGGSWLVPTLAGEPFLEEPPLYYWTAALSALAFSPVLPLHDGARLATGLYLGLALLFTGMAARELHGRGRGAAAVLLLIGTFGLLLRGHELITDIAAFAGFALAYYALALVLRKPAAGGALLGVALGLVFLAQGVLETAIVLAVTLVLPLLSRDWRTRGYARALGVALAIGAPLLAAWPLLLHAHSPALFQTWMALDAGAIVSPHQKDWFFYVRILPWHAWPAWLIAVWALWQLRHSPKAQAGAHAAPAVVLPVTGFVVTLFMLSLGSGARDLYALPLLPALALLAAAAAINLRRGAANAWLWFSAMGVTLFIVAGWFYWTALELGVPARLHAHLHRLQPGYAPGFKTVAFVLGVAASAAWFMLLARLRRSPEKPLVIWAAGVTVLWCLATALFTGVVNTGKSYRTTFEALRAAVPAGTRCVASRNLGEAQRALLHYHAGIRTQRQEVRKSSTECDVLLVQGVIRDEPAPGAGWRKIWEGGRPGDKVERFRVFQRNF